MTYGVSTAETGVKIESISWASEDPKEYSYSNFGTKDGFVHGFDPSITISVSGEIADANASAAGLIASTFGTAVTLAGQSDGVYDGHGGTETFAGVDDAGGFYLDGAFTVTESRQGFKTFDLTLISHPEIA